MTELRNIEEDIAWSIKHMDRHVWCFNTNSTSYAKELHNKVNNLLWENNIDTLFTYVDEENQRYVTLVAIDPHWAFVARVIPDTWDYTKYVEELADVYR